MVMGIIVAMTAEAVVIVAESVAAVVVAEIAGLAVAAVVIAGPVVVAADAAKRDDLEDAELTKIIRNKYQKIILRCYNLKEPSIGKDRKGASVRLQRGVIPLLLVRMH